MKAVILPALALFLSAQAHAAACTWPAWESYKQAMVSKDGRVIDRSSAQLITTSEGQSYGMFFALLANDRESFARLLQWTRNNLAGGDLSRELPAWQWGKAKSGRWQVLDSNNASDADLWIAYNLLEAGRLWQQPDYETLGRNILWRSAAQSVRKLPGLGLMLLPGDAGFESPAGWRLNPSYLPPQLLARFAREGAIWSELAENTQRLLLQGSAKGFAPDWLLWQTGQGWAPDANKGSTGSYDAIRVYLWVGMLDKNTPGRAVLLKHFAPMAQETAQLGHPPEAVDTLSGVASGAGPAGFSAALLPLLASDPRYANGLEAQRERLRQNPPLADAYYNQSLMLFGQGWDEQRYRFEKDGRLVPGWVDACTE
ncbi:Endoglucanase precursor [compost metagenome]